MSAELQFAMAIYTLVADTQMNLAIDNSYLLELTTTI